MTILPLFNFNLCTAVGSIITVKPVQVQLNICTDEDSRSIWIYLRIKIISSTYAVIQILTLHVEFYFFDGCCTMTARVSRDRCPENKQKYPVSYLYRRGFHRPDNI